MQEKPLAEQDVRTRRRWVESDGPHVPFSHTVVSDEGAIKGVCAGTGYMIGSLQECRTWQLRHGMRAKTQIIPW
jgi:hypothetical protein